MGIEVDGANHKLKLDNDGDTYLEAHTDDTIKVYVSGAEDLRIGANAINVLSGTTLTIDSGATITNSGTANGFGALAGIDDQTSSNDDQLTITDTAVVINEDSDDLDFRVESNGNANMLFVSGGNDVVGIGNEGDLGAGLHVKISDAGAISGGLNTDGDDLVVEHSGSGGISIITGTSSQGGIYFGDSGDADIGVIRYDHSANSLDFFTSGTERANFDTNGKLTLLVGAQTQENFEVIDDKGILFGTGSDFALGANGGETEFVISKGSTTTGGTTGKWTFIPTTDGVYVDLFGTEGKGPAHGLYQDDGDDNDDLWRYGQGSSDGDANGIISWSHYGGGSWAHKMRIYTTGNFATSGTHAASQSFDYAEFWEWKTELANDDKITETYGMTVVLDGDKVRLAEAGEEAKVLGVVRPNSTSTMVGGGQEIEYKDKYEKNVWGETQYEEYTQVTWEDTYNDVTVKHSYMKDRIPAKRIRHGAVKSQENWHTLESNFEKDKDGNTIDLVVPSTSSQKTAANYVERTTYGKDKGEHKAGDKLMRPKLNSSYDFTKSKSYQGRDKRRKEWCVVGLLGQVEVRDSAIVPTSWYKMKNLESGIDLYYIK